MSDAMTARISPWQRSPALTVGIVVLLALLLTLARLEERLPSSLWWQALIAPSPADLRQLLFHFSDMPRIGVVWLCGSALGMAGVCTQQVLRNPLAEPMTLGIFSGAYLALSVATVYAPGWLGAGRDAVALGGAAIALTIVFALAARRGLSPFALVLAGMIVNLCCGAFNFALAIAHFDLLSGLMIWGGGVLAQHDWQVVHGLLLRLAPCAAILILFLRPMAAFDAGDAVAGSLGVSPRTTRGAVLFLTLLITAFVVSAVGVLGFIGLAAPMLARLSGARRLRDRMLWSPVLGAALLWLADQVTQQLAGFSAALIPTGAVTTLLGAPLLLLMLKRLRGRPELAAVPSLHSHSRPQAKLSTICVVTVLVLAFAVICSLTVGRGLDGWHIASPHEAAMLMFLRVPHVVAAISTGVVLALAGGLLQRMTGNPMASPDLLGITAGGAVGFIGALFLTAHPDLPMLLLWCACGSLATLAALLLFARGSGYAPDTLILAGIAISASFQAISTIVMASDDPRVIVLYNLLAGSTYNVGAAAAGTVAAVALAALALVPFARRWLDILPLGAPVSRGLGVNLATARLSLLVASALMTAAATLVIGPLSFVGLMAPHMARMLGVRRAQPMLFMSAAIGAALMVVSDWLGRWILFPQEMPAGVVATLLGGLYLIVSMLRRN
jgi:ABC-type Fe3+-siderophore transport system permease subunit